jgi:NADH-quinone oxidoreductase subunit H
MMKVYYFLYAILGFVISAIGGILVSGIDRKVTARVQMRVGPPILQPLYDVIKLFIKETTVPVNTVRYVFLGAPLIGLAGVSLASAIILHTIVKPEVAFVGDIIVLLYLMVMPSLAVIIGAFASHNPIASLGGSREMKLVMAYELPFVLSCAVAIINAGIYHDGNFAEALKLGTILQAPPAIMKLSGIIAFIVAVLCAQAKLGLVPFDIAEAETELAGGALIEYSGPPLAIFKLTRIMMLFILPLFIIVLFCGGISFETAWGVIAGVLKYIGVVVLFVLIRNTAPRVRVDHAVKFFWGPAAVAGLIAVGLALSGL